MPLAVYVMVLANQSYESQADATVVAVELVVMDKISISICMHPDAFNSVEVYVPDCV